MPSNDFDFDPRDSSLTIGIELEYPGMSDNDEYLVSRGRPTNDIQSRIGGLPPHLDASPVYDGTVGLEIVSSRLALADAQNWYADCIEYVEEEYNEPFQPTGLMQSGNTAGLHIHLSSLTPEQAEQLYEISQTPWAKVLFCSSIAEYNDTLSWPVFRGGRYCQMNFGEAHYDVVNNRGSGHYEWRLPEPVSVEHLEVITRFLRLFEQSVDSAIEYAQELLDDVDDRITAIQRAEAVGMDIEAVPEVRREPFPESQSFYETVESQWHFPEIYRVSYDDNQYYLFDSRLTGEWEVGDVRFAHDSILRADTLEVVVDPVERDEIQRAYQRGQSDEGPRETEATDELKKLIKKKKE